MSPRNRRATGFTLLEVLVALAVLALALGAVVRGVGQQADNLSYLRDHSLAHWVALNRYHEMRVRGEWPAPGKQQGSAPMAGREWEWTVVTSETPDRELRRLDIEVRLAGRTGDALALLTGYLALP